MCGFFTKKKIILVTNPAQCLCTFSIAQQQCSSSDGAPIFHIKREWRPLLFVHRVNESETDTRWTSTPYDTFNGG